MAIIRCKMCGADLPVTETNTICKCEYCGSSQTIPSADSEKALGLFDRANRLRLTSEFDRAYNLYEDIVSEFPNEAEAYWGLVLCKYGIEYVDDVLTGEKKPTCHRLSYKNVLLDDDYKSAIRLADVVRRSQYQKEAEVLESIRSNTISISSKEDPYDIFICYKESDDFGERTIDSVIAQDIYDALTENGYKVFFARITLENKLGEEYEPYIFSALNTAKVMLVFGTQKAYFEAPWVKNEWSRFIKMMNDGQKKILIPCYKDIDPYEMPDEFKRLQSQDLGKVGTVQDLIRGINKLIPKKLSKTDLGEKHVNSGSNSDLDRNYNFGMKLVGGDSLSQKDIDTAWDLFEKLMRDYPWSYKGYYGLLNLLERIDIDSNMDVKTLISYIANSEDLDDRVRSEIENYLPNWFSYGMKQLKANNTTCAEQIFSKIIREFPDSCLGYYGLICIKPVSEEYRTLYAHVIDGSDVTQDIINDCNERLYEDMNIMYQIGIDLADANKIEDANKCFMELIRLFPESYLGYYGMICVDPVTARFHSLYSQLEKTTDHKKEDLENCIIRFTKGIEELYEKGQQEIRNRNYSAAFKLFKKIEEADKNNWRAPYGYVKIAQSGLHDKALNRAATGMDIILKSKEAPSEIKDEAARFYEEFKTVTGKELANQLSILYMEKENLEKIVADETKRIQNPFNAITDRRKIKRIAICVSVLLDILIFVILIRCSWHGIDSFIDVVKAIVKSAVSLVVIFALYVGELLFVTVRFGDLDSEGKESSNANNANDTNGNMNVSDNERRLMKCKKELEYMKNLQEIMSGKDASREGIFSIYKYLKKNNKEFSFSMRET